MVTAIIYSAIDRLSGVIDLGAVGHIEDTGSNVNRHLYWIIQSVSSLQVRPSRSISAIAEDGPQLPAGYKRGSSLESAQASRIGSTQLHAASISSRRMNNVESPRTTSKSSRS